MAAKKAKAQQYIPTVKPTQEPTWWPFRQAQGRLYMAMWVLTGLGIGLSLFLTYHHYSTGGGGGIYTRFCGGEGSYINCDAVLSSSYAYLFGLPLALWGAGAYLAVLGFVLVRWVGVATLLAAFTFGISLYLAGVSFFVIRALCVFCGTLYVINAGLFLCALYLLWQSGKVVVKRLAYGAVGVIVTVAALGWWQVVGEGQSVSHSVTESISQTPRPRDRATERLKGEGEAEFIRWYDARPTVAAGGEERHVEGRDSAAVTVVEFADFRCFPRL
jgi:uncharacterized membrane protein